MVQGVENHCAQWLAASPLEKLRMRPTPPVHLEANPRLEQRAVTMLLGALPESLRQDITSRRLTTTGILFACTRPTSQVGKKKKAKEGHQPEQEGEDAEMEKPEDTKHNIWFEGQQE